MEKLTEDSREELLAYLAAEPEYNIFIIGDLYNFGFESPALDLYAQRDSEGQFICVLMRFHENFVFYTGCPLCVNVGAVAQQIEHAPACSCINGKKEAVELLIPFFPQRKISNDYLAALRVKPEPQQIDAEPIRLAPEQAGEIIFLYTQVEEFAESYLGFEDAETENTRTGLQKGGRCYGIYKDGRLVAAASTAAENNLSAMVIGVCTHPHHRGKGYASALVSMLCHDCMGEGLSSLCLFYDNPAAGRIYRRIGFAEMGKYMMLRR